MTPEEKAAYDERQVVRHLESERNKFRRSTDIKEAISETELFLQSLLNNNIVRGRVSRLYKNDAQVSIEIERSFGTGATLYVNFRSDWDERKRFLDPDTRVLWREVNVEVTVTWGSVGARSLESAAAALDLYAELVRVGREVQLMFDGRLISSHWAASLKSEEK